KESAEDVVGALASTGLLDNDRHVLVAHQRVVALLRDAVRFLRLYTRHNAQNPPPSLGFRRLRRFRYGLRGRGGVVFLGRSRAAQELALHVSGINADESVDDLSIP